MDFVGEYDFFMLFGIRVLDVVVCNVVNKDGFAVDDGIGVSVGCDVGFFVNVGLTDVEGKDVLLLNSRGCSKDGIFGTNPDVDSIIDGKIVVPNGVGLDVDEGMNVVVGKTVGDVVKVGVDVELGVKDGILVRDELLSNAA